MRITEKDIHLLGWDDDYEQFNRRFDDLKNGIARHKGVERDLRTLVRAGADRNTLLELLVHVVQDLRQGWRVSFKEKQDTFRAAVRQIHDAIEGVEKVANDPLCRGELWLLLLNPDVDSIKTGDIKKFQRRVTYMLRMMRAYERWAIDMAEAFGKQMRKQTQVIRNRKVGTLLNYVRHKTGMNHDDIVARLLTDAHDVVGSNKQFSADQLKKLRQRHCGITTPPLGSKRMTTKDGPHQSQVSRKGQRKPS
jgi:hypothetical protein